MNVRCAVSRLACGRTVEPPGTVVALFPGVRTPGCLTISISEGHGMRTIPTPPWVLLLAGGAGRRLEALHRQIAGDPRPRQFCGILECVVRLGRTRRRAGLVARPARQVGVVSRPREPYYRGLCSDLGPDRRVVQPRIACTA